MQEKQNKPSGSWGEVFRTVFWALLIAMIFRSFLFQPFHIPSGSMKPSLLIGDYLIVSKYSYGYSKHSFPFSPDIFEGRKFYTPPKRGDIIVFKVPGRAWGEDVFIKRLIGLPGDEIQVKEGVVYINNQKLELQDDGEFFDNDLHTSIKHFIETLPNGIKHSTLDMGESRKGNFFDIDPDNTDVYKVPDGKFFMMGDNRDNSTDSRFPEPGFVPEENLIGRAEIILFSSEGKFWNPTKWRLSRFFTLLR